MRIEKLLESYEKVEVINGRYKGIKGRIIGKSDTQYEIVADNAAQVDFVKQGEYIRVNKEHVKRM